jgi:hypothetical protein
MLSFKSLPVLLGVFVVFLTANPAAGSIVKALELEELVGQSEQILVGRVVFSESFVRENGNLGTWHRIQIERDIRGSAPSEGEVIVETLGGQVGDIAMRVEGEPSFSEGERVVVFIRDGGPYTVFRPVGMGQGVMRVRTEAGVDTVTQTREGMVLMRRNARGYLEKSAGALPDKERLDVFLSRVRALVELEAGDADE